MKEYKYKAEKRIVKGKKYDVIIPKNHSKITHLIYETIDINANDSYANISRWHTTCMVIRFGKTKWEILYDGNRGGFYLNGESMLDGGIFNILFQLESRKVRSLYLRIELIKFLQVRIKKDSQKLKRLEKSKEKQ